MVVVKGGLGSLQRVWDPGPLGFRVKSLSFGHNPKP